MKIGQEGSRGFLSEGRNERAFITPFKPLWFLRYHRAGTSTFSTIAYNESSMEVSFKSPQPKSAMALLSRPLGFSVIAGQAGKSTFAAAAPLWGLGLLKFGVELPSLVNYAKLLRILKETSILLYSASGLPLPRQTCLLNFSAKLPFRQAAFGLSSSALSSLPKGSLQKVSGSMSRSME